MKRSQRTGFVLSALFAALTAIFSQISIPLPFTPVPITLSTLAFFLSGGLLGAKYGFISQLVYLVLGLVGIPVFAQLTAGPAILFGPTGGYILGYALGALVIGLLYERFSSRCQNSFLFSGACLILGLLVCYLPGTLWFMLLTGNGAAAALSMCVLPFLPGDALKITAAALLLHRLRPLVATL